MACACAADPIADGDVFDIGQGAVLEIADAAAGVLKNDTANADAVIEVIDSVAHGDLVLDEKRGTFTYTPSPGFSGMETFTYRLSQFSGEVEFVINESRSMGELSAKLETAFGNDSDKAKSKLSGRVRAEILSVDALTEVRITEFDAVLADPVEMSFCLLRIFTCAAGVDISAKGDAISVSMKTAGAASPVAANGAFDQMGSTVAASGGFDADATGLAAPLIGEGGEFLLDDQEVEVDLNGTIKKEGGKLVLTLPVSFPETIFVIDPEEPDQGAIVSVEGQAIAEADLSKLEPAHSQIATVTINVLAAPAGVPFQIASIARVDGGMQIAWPSESGATYQVESGEGLDVWEPVGDAQMAESAESVAVVSLPGEGRTAYWRVRKLP